jgi:hypothetical protein
MFKMTPQFYTEWALNWAKNVESFTEMADSVCYVNLRPNVYEAQREFEKNLTEVMNYGTHNPLY